MIIDIIDDGNVLDNIEVPELIEEIESNDDSEEEFDELLNPSFCRDFRNAINSTPIFWSDGKYMAQYHLSCAVMDRLDTCVRKLNTYGDYPDSEEDFLVFMMFAAMATDAVKEILAQLGICAKNEPIYNSDEDYKFFKPAYINSQIYNPDAKIPTDDKFFKYIRALSFAHPTETSQQKFIRKGETQYSPWVIVNHSAMSWREYKDGVGVRVYSSLLSDTLDLIFSFETLKEYVRSRYERIALATQWVYDQIENTKREWCKRKIKREQSPLEILREIHQILQERFEDCDYIQDMIRYMECRLTNKANYQAVERYRNTIIELIPGICDAIDNLDHQLAAELCSVLFDRPQKMHSMATYQLEKILCNLRHP